MINTQRNYTESKPEFFLFNDPVQLLACSSILPSLHHKRGRITGTISVGKEKMFMVNLLDGHGDRVYYKHELTKVQQWGRNAVRNGRAVQG